MAQQVHLVGGPDHPSTLIDDPDDLDDQVLSFFVSYWRKKKGGAPLPLRQSFVPKEVKANLS